MRRFTLSTMVVVLMFVSGCAVLQGPQEQTNEAVAPVPRSMTEPETTRRLIVRGAGLDKLPSYILKMKNLEELDISDNALTGALPSEIGSLENLRVLDASGNQMTGLPAEIGRLKKLEQLDLSNNQLTGLPYELGNLQNLKTLILSGNEYSRTDLNVIRGNLPKETRIIE